mmetsp:Transcript_54174/g.161432  ORF Transcript_54174/g.161432 Transcript_54174/m.161432 type:complete len:88 (-) Transcript_54174:633-896(-)
MCWGDGQRGEVALGGVAEDRRWAKAEVAPTMRPVGVLAAVVTSSEAVDASGGAVCSARLRCSSPATCSEMLWMPPSISAHFSTSFLC